METRIRESALGREEKLKESTFDETEKISRDDWEAMKAKLEDWRQGKEWDRWDRFFTLAVPMKILFPERENELGLDDKAREEIMFRLESSKKGKVWDTYFEKAFQMKILFPEKADEIDFDKDYKVSNAWREELRGEFEYVEEEDPNRVYVPPFEAKIICPEVVEEFVDWQYMKEEEDYWRDDSLWGHIKKNWFDFSRQAMKMKIFFPERANELGLDDKAWKEMNALLETLRMEKKWSAFAQMAMAMKVLAAEKLKITNRGIEFSGHRE